MSKKVPITVAHGDGIGPEIMQASLRVLEAAGAALDIETIDIGEKVYLSGNSAGIAQESWDSLRRTKVFLKAPITTPQGGGYKSLNVTVRKTMGQFANVRPCVSYAPFVRTKHPNMDVVIIRENEEDLYAGIEYRITDEVYQCLKLITRPGCEKIVRYAFAYARANGRKKVTCFSKDNIMKMTDGLFHKVFDEVSVDYPELEKEHWIVDIGAAKLADTPEAFDVIVMPNLYGDILSDVAAQIAGSVGLAGSSNIGAGCAMFEAIHGSAPRRAGQNVANPSGLMMGSFMMLVHIGQSDVAERAHNAWLKTLEEGLHTYDIFQDGISKQKLGTKEFADAVIARLGQKPSTLKPVDYSKAAANPITLYQYVRAPDVEKKLLGVDIYIHHRGTADEAGEKMKTLAGAKTELQMLTNRGLKVWPNGAPETFLSDNFRCRFMAKPDSNFSYADIGELVTHIANAGMRIAKTESLHEYAGEIGFTMGQGQ